MRAAEAQVPALLPYNRLSYTQHARPHPAVQLAAGCAYVQSVPRTSTTEPNPAHKSERHTPTHTTSRYKPTHNQATMPSSHTTCTTPYLPPKPCLRYPTLSFLPWLSAALPGRCLQRPLAAA